MEKCLFQWGVGVCPRGGSLPVRVGHAHDAALGQCPAGGILQVRCRHRLLDRAAHRQNRALQRLSGAPQRQDLLCGGVPQFEWNCGDAPSGKSPTKLILKKKLIFQILKVNLEIEEKAGFLLWSIFELFIIVLVQ